MANISLENLARYDGKIKEYVEDKYLSKNTANWQMTEKAGAVTCYPVPDTELEPIVDFSFKEMLPAEGDKSPSNPSTIEGVNNVTVNVIGKNLIPLVVRSPLSFRGVDYTFNNNGFTYVNGTATGGDSFFWLDEPPSNLNIPAIKGHTYTISGCPQGGSSLSYGMTVALFDKNGKAISYNVLNDFGNGKTWTATHDGFFGVCFRINTDSTANQLLFKPQLEDSSVKTEYEIPERLITNYSLGNTYYGGSVNLATGMITVTQIAYELDSSSVWNATSRTYVYRTLKSPATPTFTQNIGLFKSSHFSLSTANPADMPVNTFFARADGNIIISTDGLSMQAFKDWLDAQKLAGTPVVVTYPLYTPYTIQFTPIQIKSLFALDKNIPRLNTLYTDADSIQVGYQKHLARTSYELENAILALGGGE